MAGMIKAALVLQKDQVPPNLNFQTANPKIPLERLQLKVSEELHPLPHVEGQRPVAAVNSFGFGGTNAHLVLEAAPSRIGNNGSEHSNGKPASHKKLDRPFVLPISARDDRALRNYVKSFVRQLRDTTAPLEELCYSAGERKEHHPQRLSIVGRDHQEMRDRLSGWLSNPEGFPLTVNGNASTDVGPITFVFTGQGAQWWAMGQQLIEREPIFRETIQKIDQLISKLADWSLLEEMTRDEATSSINETYIAQPAIFGLQVALVELWKSWGIVPERVIGHSVGEVAAAYCAGIYSLEDAVTVVVHRSRLQHTTGGNGGMLAAGVSAATARKMIGDRAEQVAIAAINSPTLVTLSGDTAPLQEVADHLEEQAKFFRWLPIDYAFHTHQMDPIKDELLTALAGIDPQPGNIPMISTVTGGVLLGEKLDAMYWWRNVREPVLFATGMAACLAGPKDANDGVFLEIGPHPALRSSIEDCVADHNQKATVLHTLRRKTDESEQILVNLAGLHGRGVPIDWKTVNQSHGELVRLPSYPWSHEQCWIESDLSVQKRLGDPVHCWGCAFPRLTRRGNLSSIRACILT
jgi:acyl transferase domain-containing protein